MKHVKNAEIKTISSFIQTHADEDTVVESLGSQLRCGRRSVFVDQVEMNGIWRWSIAHTKFRGRGPRPDENYVGADVILEFRFLRSQSNVYRVKSALFQAKKELDSDSSFFGQAIKLSTWREAAFGVNFSADSLDCYDIDTIIKYRGKFSSHKGRRFSDFLVNMFIGGNLGDEDLRYDPRKHRLYWVDMQRDYVFVRFSCKHRFQVDVWAPGPASPYQNAVQIPLENIYEHRLLAEPYEILSISPDSSLKEVITARRKLQRIYHPDQHMKIENSLQDLMLWRSKEINESAHEYTERKGQ